MKRLTVFFVVLMIVGFAGAQVFAQSSFLGKREQLVVGAGGRLVKIDHRRIERDGAHLLVRRPAQVGRVDERGPRRVDLRDERIPGMMR